MNDNYYVPVVDSQTGITHVTWWDYPVDARSLIGANQVIVGCNWMMRAHWLAVGCASFDLEIEVTCMQCIAALPCMAKRVLL